MLFKAKDSKLTSRLVKVLAQVKNMDRYSARGARNVAEGLSDVAAKALLTGFDFNARASLGGVLNTALSVDLATGEVTIAAFNPMEQMHGAEGATHFSLQSGFLDLDFETGAYDMKQSP